MQTEEIDRAEEIGFGSSTRHSNPHLDPAGTPWHRKPLFEKPMQQKPNPLLSRRMAKLNGGERAKS